MENLKTQIAKATTKEKIVVRALKKLHKLHYTTRAQGKLCGCRYCLVMIQYIETKIAMHKRRQYWDAIWVGDDVSQNKMMQEMGDYAYQVLQLRNKAKSLRAVDY